MALQGKPGSYTVLVLAPAGDIQVRAIKVGLMNVATVQVIAGVAEGEKVILDVPGAATPPPAATSPASSASVGASPSSSKKNKKSPSPTAAASGSSPTSSATSQ
jgi:hypothetical protein